jgi:hypothetical protein
MNGHIYLIRNLVNGKGYIGQTIQTISAHKGNHPSDDTANKMKKAQHERRKREAEYAKH